METHNGTLDLTKTIAWLNTVRHDASVNPWLIYPLQRNGKKREGVLNALQRERNV